MISCPVSSPWSQRRTGQLITLQQQISGSGLRVSACALGTGQLGHTHTPYQNHEDRLMACFLDSSQASQTRQDWPWNGAGRLYFSICVCVGLSEGQCKVGSWRTLVTLTVLIKVWWLRWVRLTERIWLQTEEMIDLRQGYWQSNVTMNEASKVRDTENWMKPE